MGKGHKHTLEVSAADRIKWFMTLWCNYNIAEYACRWGKRANVALLKVKNVRKYGVSR